MRINGNNNMYLKLHYGPSTLKLVKIQIILYGKKYIDGYNGFFNLEPNLKNLR
ncbi:hypothetical protein BH23THE1_BH23THE1_22470 [soil metagenome]